MTPSVPSAGDLSDLLSDLTSAHGNPTDRLALMNENAPIYRGRGATEVERLRATVMVRLAEAGLAEALMPYVVEELETATSAYPVAAAARVVRSATALPSELAPLLSAAIERIRAVDDFVNFDTFPAPPNGTERTAIGEATATLAMLQENIESAPARPCCGGGERAAPRLRHLDDVGAVMLQDQEGRLAAFRDIFAGRTSLIAFFYTRCMNPDKCSRTISQLAQVERLLRARDPSHDVMIAGITYDPEYDLPHRLHRYGTDRGIIFSDNCQLLRTRQSFAPIRDGLDLGVGYGASTVNRHRIELLLCDVSGEMVDLNVRRLWDAEEVAGVIAAREAARRDAPRLD